MDKHYADTVRLLLNITPDVFDNDTFGGNCQREAARKFLPSVLQNL